jgi:hypothetical protein
MAGKEAATIRAHSPRHRYSFIKQEMKEEEVLFIGL